MNQPGLLDVISLYCWLDNTILSILCLFFRYPFWAFWLCPFYGPTCWQVIGWAQFKQIQSEQWTWANPRSDVISSRSVPALETTWHHYDPTCFTPCKVWYMLVKVIMLGGFLKCGYPKSSKWLDYFNIDMYWNNHGDLGVRHLKKPPYSINLFEFLLDASWLFG